MTVQLHTEAFVPTTHFITSGEVGKISLGHNGRDFFVVDSKNLKSNIPSINLCDKIRGISLEGLEKALSVGYLAVSKSGEEYALRFNVRLAGGGPLFAALAYVGTTVAGGVLCGIGFVTTPIGIGLPIMAAGTAVIAAAPFTLAVTLAPTP